MATKEVKSLLKSARTALDKQEYEEAIKHCEAVLWSDSSNYLANVIAGKAHLLLGKREDAKLHYKKAVSTQPQEQLAWKGLADLYDKHGHNGTDEDITDAISAYSNILETLSDNSKKIVVTGKLASLYKDCGNIEQASMMYERVLSSDPQQDLLSEGLIFLLSNGPYTDSRWAVVRDSYEGLLIRGVVLDASTELIKAYINGLTRWVKSLTGEECQEMVQCLRGECERLLDQKEEEVKEMATRILCLIELWNILQSCRCGKFPPLDNFQRDLLSKDKEFSPCYQAIVQSSNHQIKEGCELSTAATKQSPDMCEYWAIACYCHMMSHDYHMTINNARQGTCRLSAAPLMLQNTLKSIFHQCLVEAMILSNQSYQALDIIKQHLCNTDGSHDYHVTELHVRALVDCNKLDEAEHVLHVLSLSVPDDQEHVLAGLRGLVSMAAKDFQSAAGRFEVCIKAVPDSPWYFYNKGVCLMTWSEGDKKQACQCLIKAAQLDPFNPHVFLQLGHYQRHITGDLRRAAKCYQKSFGSCFSPVSAGLSLGEIYTTLGDEESAFKAYQEVISKAAPSQSKEAWLRVGLHHRKYGRYEEAIKCFLTVLRQNSSDFRVWECIAEAYLSRGSQNSALKAFHRAVELNPESIYCQYQIASIQHLLGHLPEAVEGYTAVLHIDQSYVPALKGRAEAYFGLVQEALEKTFDGKAVDLVSFALKDLSKAVLYRPKFFCLWKLVGDCCLSLCHVTSELISLIVPSSLLDGNHGDSVSVNKQEILKLAISSYGQALQLSDDHTLSSSPLLHNIALAYYSLAKDSTTDEIQNLSVAFELIKRAVSLSPSNHQYWNTLGVVSSHPLLATPSLAQHAFIKSLTMEPNNAMAWANLGSLYLTHNNVQLAHSAFAKAQSCDPTHVEGWVGDGLVAEVIGQEREAMNFFYISSEIKYHPESALGFGEWVCHNLSTSKEEDILSSSRMFLTRSAHHKTLQARDGLVRYILRNPSDPCGLNLLGLLYEQEGLIDSAEQSIAKARELLSNGEGSNSLPQLVHVMNNHARLLSTKGEYTTSLETFQALNIGGSPLSMEYALALYRSGMFSEAATIYESLMPLFDDKKKPYLLLASAIATLGDKNTEDCKSKLFKVFQTPPPIVHGMISLAAFAGYSDDITLLHATLKEIEKIIEIDPSSVDHIHPSCQRVLGSLVHYLANNHYATECREAVERILSNLPIYEDNKTVPIIQDVLQDILSLPPDQSLATIQKIIHSFPGDVWVWSVLCYVLFVLGKQTEAKKLLSITIFKAQKLCDNVQSNPQILQLKTNKLQVIQLLLSWTKQFNSILN